MLFRSPDAIMIGEYQVTAYSCNPNYKITNAINTYTIHKKVITITEYDDYYVGNGMPWEKAYNNDNVSGIADTDEFTATLKTVSGALGEYVILGDDLIWDVQIFDKSTHSIDVSLNYEFIFNVFISIREAPIPYEFEDLVVDYTGEYQSPTLVLGIEDVKVTYVLSDGTVTDEIPEFMNAGSYEIQFILEKEGYETLNATVEFIINKIDPVIIVSIDSKEFDGKDIRVFASGNSLGKVSEETNEIYTVKKGTPAIPSIDVIDADILDFDEDIEFYRNLIYRIEYINLATGKHLSEAPIDAGQYRMVVTMLETDNYLSKEFTADFEISKQLSRFDKEKVDGVELSIDAVKGLSSQYGQDLTYLEYTMIGTGVVNIVYINPTTGETSTIKPTEAGNYIARFYVEEASNYEDNIIDVPFIISPRQLAIQGRFEHVYNGSVWSKSLSDEGFKLGYITPNGDFSDLELSELNNVSMTGTISTLTDTYGIHTDFVLDNLELFIDGIKVDSNNFTIEFFDLVVEIIKTKAEFEAYPPQNLIYDGTAKMIEFDMSKVIGNYTVYYSLVESDNLDDYSSSITFVNAGTYKVYYFILFDNYSESTGCIEFTIEKAEPTLELVKEMVMFNSSEIRFSKEDFASNSLGNITYVFYDLEGNILSGSPIEVGSYRMVITIAETENYIGKTIEAIFEITPAILNLKWNNTSLEFNGKVQLPSVSTPVDEDLLGLTIEVVAGDGKSIGSHTAKAVISNKNYRISAETETVQYEITPVVVEYIPEITMEYTGTKPEQNPNAPYTYLDWENVGSAVGSYEYRIMLEDLVNNQWSDGSQETIRNVRLNIVEKDIASRDVSYTRMPSQVYTGTKIEPTVILIYRGERLVKGVDFEVTYENNINVFSTAKVTITGINNFTGTIEDSFYIDSSVIRLAEDSDYKFVTAYGPTKFVEEDHKSYNQRTKTLITNVKSQTTIKDFLNNFIEAQRSNVKIYNGSKLINAALYDRMFIGTGMTVIFTNDFGTTIDLIYVSILGDLNGDGRIDVSDSSALLQGISNNSLTYHLFYAADINKDGFVNVSDYLALTEHINGSKKIEE